MGYFQEGSDLNIKMKIIALYGKNLETLQNDVGRIKVWLTTQPHLPQVLADKQIESYIILCKFNIEKVKSKIDMYFTMRTMFPDIFNDSHPFCDRMKHAQKQVFFVPLPKLSEDLSRIFVIKIKPDSDPVDLDPYASFAYMLNIANLRIWEDMCAGHTILFDLQYAKMGHLMKLTPMFLKTSLFIGDKALTTRVTSFHMVNAPNFIDQTLMIFKTVVKPKLAERIIVHKDAESAIRDMDKNILPSDYGGYEKSLSELEEMLVERFEHYRDFFDQQQHWQVDEDLRAEKLKDDGFFGCYGNFKKLQVD